MDPGSNPKSLRVTALAGGIGAAKFLVGLLDIVTPESLTIIVNTGDDIELHGLRVSPDLDTVTYTLAGVVNPATGWGIAGDQFNCLEWLGRYGSPAWFNLGDQDLATHIYRTNQLRLGRTLGEVTDHIARSLGVKARILPMSDSYVPTAIATDAGEIHIQEYFVRLRCEPAVRAIRYVGIESATPAPGVLETLRNSDAVIICPSNPFISIAPILAVPGIREEIETTAAVVAAVTPIVGGKALKGPAAEMLRDLGHEVSAAAVAKFYGRLLDVFVLDEQDAALGPSIAETGVKVAIADTVMATMEDKKRLARHVLDFIGGLSGTRHWPYKSQDKSQDKR
ncbi:MAG TPA: 2-phospho-L-lactate transferase [Blastocatellia bacterium]|nr:2-phospho-L-lactate transferase [Blastocatellia bacterium]